MDNWFEWNEDKNAQLKAERNISFDEIVFAILDDRLLALIPHPNSQRYPGQMIYIVEYNDYAYLVPFVVNNDVRFLKTIIPSRKATRRYLRKQDNE